MGNPTRILLHSLGRYLLLDNNLEHLQFDKKRMEPKDPHLLRHIEHFQHRLVSGVHPRHPNLNRVRLLPPSGFGYLFTANLDRDGQHPLVKIQHMDLPQPKLFCLLFGLVHCGHQP